MQPDLYTKYELSQVKEDLKALDFKYSPVETRPFIVDFSEPFKANQWIEEMRGASPNPRPAGIIGQIKYYKGEQEGDDHNTYQFLLSSQNNQAAITDLLNFECRTPKTTSKDASTYQTTEYYDIVEVMRPQKNEAVKFATNILRLIKGTSFSKKEKGLIGLKETIDCCLDFVAILFTSEGLRDPRSKYLAMSELYKLKKEEIDIDALFHPIHGRYVPARIIEAKFLEKFATKWKPIPEKDRSKIEPNFSKGGAQQMRDVSDKQIREHYFDEKMQSYYQIHQKSPGKDESLLREKIQDIEEDWERYEEKWKEKRDKLIDIERKTLEIDIRSIEENLKGKEKQKAIAERKALCEAAIEYAEEDYELRSKDLKKEHNWDKFQDARQKLEELKDYSFSGFRFWVLEKFEKAQLICQNIKNE